MIDDSDAILDDLLCRWHTWAQAAKVGRGFADRALVCGDFKSSRQYDDSNGALDDDLDAFRSRAVDFAASQMRDPWRAAIYVNARNIATGRDVWTSPRLPESHEERGKVLTVARGQMVVLLINAGVM